MNISLPVNNLKTVMHANGINSDIISALEQQFMPGVEAVRSIAHRFKGHTEIETARNVWNYLRYRCKYKKDDPGKQQILTPGRLIDASNKGRGCGDCKSFALFANSIFGALGYRCGFSYASYQKNNPIPSHVYAYLIDRSGNTIICDGVYHRFNAEAGYQHKFNHPMEISVLSGIGAPSPTSEQMRARKPITLEHLITKVRPGSIYHTVISNALHRKAGTAQVRGYNTQQLQRYVRHLNAASRNLRPSGALYRLMQDEIKAASTTGFSGDVHHMARTQSIKAMQEEIGALAMNQADPIEGFSLKKINIKNIKKGLKKISLKNAVKALRAVTFLPHRKAALAVIRVNFRGIASRLYNNPKTKEKVLRAWVDKFGGNRGTLNAAINKGSNLKPLLGGRIHGIDDGIGIDPATAAALATAAAPIILYCLKALKGDKVPETPGAEGAEKEASNAGGETLLEKAENFIKQALPSVTSTGVVPEAPMTPEQAAADKALPADLDESGAGLDLMGTVGKFAVPALLIGGGLYFATRKPKK